MRKQHVLKLLCFLGLGAAALPSVAQAQVTINMSRITCADYLAMTPEQSDVFGAWVSGFFNQKTGYTWIDVGAQRRNVASVRAWCATYPGEFVMTGLARATGTAAFQGDPDKAAVRVDMSSITCREFVDYAYDKQVMIGAWMSGYYNASLNRQDLDITRYRANSKRVSNYCKRRKKDTLMNAIQRVAL
jgi:HdeA/HdeB family